MRDFLAAGFDYDLWANRAWSSVFQSAPDAAPILEVFEHMLFAQQIWLTRVGASIADHEGFEQRMVELHDGWTSVIAERDLNEVIRYKNLQGLDFERPLGEIAWHVLNHGTYHRGQMRQICSTLGFKGWPETDLVRYFDDLRSESLAS